MPLELPVTMHTGASAAGRRMSLTSAVRQAAPAEGPHALAGPAPFPATAGSVAAALSCWGALLEVLAAASCGHKRPEGPVHTPVGDFSTVIVL